MVSESVTPMMKQYLELKRECRDAILFFRLGDFYEMFFEDAVEAARILHITLTSRGSFRGAKIPMCGVPHHAAENYIARLVKDGRKVAVCEQAEEISGKKIFDRKITRIITPGTFVAEGTGIGPENSYILSISMKDGVFGVAYADISTGEFCLTEIDGTEGLFPEIYKIGPVETILPREVTRSKEIKELKEAGLGSITINDDWLFDPVKGREELKRHFGLKTLDAFGCHEMEIALGAAGALLLYLQDTQKCRLSNIRTIKAYSLSEYMTLDRVSHRHLELVENQEDLTSTGTLFEVLDRTMTPMGKRKLKKWLLNPLLDQARILRRHDAVQFFCENSPLRAEVREILGKVYDIERLSNKVILGTCNARDMLSLSDSLENVEAMKKIFDTACPEEIETLISET
jgi:DNA mismatch repair protein MutS